MGSSTLADDYSSAAPSEGSSAASTFEPLHAGGVDLGDPVLEPSVLDVILNLTITQSAFVGFPLPVEIK